MSYLDEGNFAYVGEGDIFDPPSDLYFDEIGQPALFRRVPGLRRYYGRVLDPETGRMKRIEISEWQYRKYLKSISDPARRADLDLRRRQAEAKGRSQRLGRAKQAYQRAVAAGETTEKFYRWQYSSTFKQIEQKYRFYTYIYRRIGFGPQYELLVAPNINPTRMFFLKNTPDGGYRYSQIVPIGSPPPPGFEKSFAIVEGDYAYVLEQLGRRPVGADWAVGGSDQQAGYVRGGVLRSILEGNGR